MVEEYHSLKKQLRQIRKVEFRVGDKPVKRDRSDKLLLSAWALLRKSNTELQDCPRLLENLCSVLSSGKLTGHSPELQLIWLLIRRATKS